MSKKFIYDKEAEVLSVEMSKGKSVDSDIHDNLVIDYNKDGSIIRINFYNFSFSSFRNSLKSLKSFARNARFPVLVR